MRTTWTALGLALALAACARQPGSGGGAAPAKQLNLYIWSAYLPDEVIREFTARTGIAVRFDLYDSNEALLGKLQSGVADYDLVVPSDYMVRILVAETLVQPLDPTRLKNLGNLDPRFLDQEFDPGNLYTLPYFWGTTGLGYDKAKLGPIDSWQALFDPRYKGRILMLDDMREDFAVALETLGHSINETDPQVLAAAAALLERQKPLVKTYDSGDFANVLAAGDVDLAHGYNGQLAQVVRAAPERLAYVVPKEGCTLWLDNVAIPTKARHLEAAYAFLDFIMEPEVNARIVDGTSYASANLPARRLIRPEILHDAAIFPGDDVIARCHLLRDLGPATTLLDRYWTEIKAR